MKTYRQKVRINKIYIVEDEVKAVLQEISKETWQKNDDGYGAQRISQDTKTKTIYINNDKDFDADDYAVAEDDDRSYRVAKNNTIVLTNFYYLKNEMEYIDVANVYFLNVDNAYNAGYERCCYCGEWYNTSYDGYYNELNGESYCSEECLNSDGYTVCADCGDICRTDDSIYIEDIGAICDECYSNEGYFYCDGCGNCYSDNCYGGSTNDGYTYCDDCWEDEHGKDIIKSYHTAKSDDAWEFWGDGSLYFGTELEVEAKESATPEEIATAVEEIAKNGNVYLHYEHDGSLDNGVEIISDPMTLDYIYAHEDIIRKYFTKITELGGRSHDTSTCGLHIHVTRNTSTHEEARIVYMFERFKNELQAFSRRTSNNIEHWTKFYNLSSESQRVGTIKQRLDTHDRYKAVNLTNRNTIEIRLFRGTLKFETYLASIELVNNIVLLAKKSNEKKLYHMTFKDIIDYKPTKYLKEYAKSKNLYSEGAA